MSIPPAVAEFAVEERQRLLERITQLEAHCVRLGQGGAERYWENRWREADAELDAMKSQPSGVLLRLHLGDDALWAQMECDGKHAAVNLDSIPPARWFCEAYRARLNASPVSAGKRKPCGCGPTTLRGGECCPICIGNFDDWPAPKPENSFSGGKWPVRDLSVPSVSAGEPCKFLKDAELRLNAVLGYSEDFDDLLATVNTACLRIRRLEGSAGGVDERADDQ